MKIKKQFILRTIADETVLIPVGNTVLTFNGVFRLSNTGKEIWKMLQDDAEKDEIVAFIKEKYVITYETANEDVTSFLDMLTEFGIV